MYSISIVITEKNNENVISNKILDIEIGQTRFLDRSINAAQYIVKRVSILRNTSASNPIQLLEE